MHTCTLKILCEVLSVVITPATFDTVRELLLRAHELNTYAHFNEVNVKLQGLNKTVIVMMDLIRAFEAKLYAFRNDIIIRNYKYFPNSKRYIKDLDAQEK
ncbi:general transcription factor II-I repeat domain-containing protein 2A [Trichonephila clavipes]|nr:general transcription factor II-I repeat domain-containing protein 2A [Trichonephila clavipes]